MGLQEIQTEVGFSDGEIIGCDRAGDILTVFVKAWNEERLRVVFKDVLLVRDLIPGSICGLYEHDDSTELLETAIAHLYDERPEHHAYKHYTFLDNDGRPCLDVVASGKEVLRG